MQAPKIPEALSAPLRRQPTRHLLHPAPPIFLMVVAAAALLILGLPPVVLVIRALTAEGVVMAAAPLLDAMLLSLTTTSISLVVIVLLGTPLAYLFARYNFPFKRILNTLIELPIVMPPVVAGLALLMVFGRQGVLGAPLRGLGVSLPFSPVAVVIAQVFVAAPFFVRAAQTRFGAIPREIEEAAEIDGASRLTTFRHVTLPLSARAMVTGLILSWARALGEFGATILFAGNIQGRTQTMPLLVYNALERDIDTALLTAAALIAAAVCAMLLARWVTRSLEEGDPLAET